MTDVLIEKLNKRVPSNEMVNNKIMGDVLDTIGMSKRDLIRMQRMLGLNESQSAESLPSVKPNFNNTTNNFFKCKVISQRMTLQKKSKSKLEKIKNRFAYSPF